MCVRVCVPERSRPFSSVFSAVTVSLFVNVVRQGACRRSRVRIALSDHRRGDVGF